MREEGRVIGKKRKESRGESLMSGQVFFYAKKLGGLILTQY